MIDDKKYRDLRDLTKSYFTLKQLFLIRLTNLQRLKIRDPHSHLENERNELIKLGKVLLANNISLEVAGE